MIKNCTQDIPRKDKIATRNHVSPAATENWECNVLQGTCKFGDTILLNALFCKHDNYSCCILKN